MLDRQTYNTLSKKYGYTSSWAIWAESSDGRAKSNTEDMSPFHNTGLLNVLNPDFIFVGINPARHVAGEDTEPWQGFHSRDKRRSQDYKLRYALKDTKYWGSFLTDLFPEIRSTDAGQVFRQASTADYQKSVDTILEIYQILGGKSTIVAIGNKAYAILDRYLPEGYCLKKIMHFSSFIGAVKYREIVLSQLAG